MAVRRKILTLTLIGLMAAFMFPICANAQTDYGEEPPTELTVTQTSDYDAMPTFGWTCISGPTSFVITAGTQVSPEGGVSAGTVELVKDPTKPDDPGVNKWTKHEGTPVTGKDGYYSYTYKPTTALPVGTVSSWQVKAVRAAKTKDDADPGFTGTNSTATDSTAFTVFGNVVLSMTADKTQVTAGKDTVTVTVALDNSAATSGGVSVKTLDFSVTYDTTLLDIPVVTKMGRVTTTPTVAPAADKVTVKIAEAIVPGTEGIVTLAFKAKDGVAGGDVTFAFADVAVTSDNADPIPPATSNPATSTATAVTEVLPAATPGVLISGATTPDDKTDDIPQLKDAVVALKVATSLPLNLVTAETTALTNYAKAMGPIGVDDAVEILGMLAK
jgi:hypothetical protein